MGNLREMIFKVGVVVILFELVLILDLTQIKINTSRHKFLEQGKVIDIIFYEELVTQFTDVFEVTIFD
jgi:hypothetical protein